MNQKSMGQGTNFNTQMAMNKSGDKNVPRGPNNGNNKLGGMLNPP